MPRAGVDPEAVVAAAAEIADAHGLERLTLAQVADQLGIRSPSLYAHVESLADLRTRLAVRGTRELAAALQTATTGRAGAAALRAAAHAYRAYALEHPGTYAAINHLPGAAVDPAPLLAALDGCGLRGDDAAHGVQLMCAALHGFVSLEQRNGFPMAIDADETYERLIAMLERGLVLA